ncbi:RsbRD N-terminal domain-containing protein [Elusimicrobiota bacterium]
MLFDLLARQEERIVKLWFDSVARTYPQETQEFLKSKANQFGNPVGHNTRDGLRAIFRQIISNNNTEDLRKALDLVIRIRSVQDFTAPAAVVFVYQLKKIIRQELSGQWSEIRAGDEWEKFEDRLDALALLAFDVYTDCRESLNQIRTNEIKKQTSKLIESTNVPCGGTCKEEGLRD